MQQRWRQPQFQICWDAVWNVNKDRMQSTANELWSLFTSCFTSAWHRGPVFLESGSVQSQQNPCFVIIIFALICRYALASHFLWGLWSIIQAKISKIEFGYMVRRLFFFSSLMEALAARYIYFNTHDNVCHYVFIEKLCKTSSHSQPFCFAGLLPVSFWCLLQAKKALLLISHHLNQNVVSHLSVLIILQAQLQSYAAPLMTSNVGWKVDIYVWTQCTSTI